MTNCPYCIKENVIHKLGKAGGAISGLKKVQRYYCSRCHHKPIDVTVILEDYRDKKGG